MLVRHLESKLREGVSATPVILLNGARQTGKSTLVRQMVDWHHAQYLTLDDNNILLAAQSDPIAFISSLSGNIILEEIQRAPGIFLAIKKAVDETRTPGRFILTGSANVLLLPKVADSLAGRMDIYTLWPFSQGEILNQQDNFIENIFKKDFTYHTKSTLNKEDYTDLFLRGGYPEIVLERKEDARRNRWYDAYLTSIIQRDIRDLMHIEGSTHLPQLLELLATRSGALINFADISREMGYPQTTLKRYFSLLTMTFLVTLLPAWHETFAKRISKSPKLLLGDTGLLCHLLRADKARLLNEPYLLGRVLENFVILELFKQSGWNETAVKFYHWRTHSGDEVDLIIENQRAEIVAIEIKSSSTINQNDLKALRLLADNLGDRFCRGIILYTGKDTIAFSDKIVAMPISALWSS